MNADTQYLTAGLIGCGYIGSMFNESSNLTDIYSHASAYSHHHDTRLVAVCDQSSERVNRCGARWNVEKRYTQFQQFLENAPDLVSICTPDETHFTITREVITSGKVRGILCEKPLTTDLEEGRELVALAASHGVTLIVNYSRRFHTGHQRSRDLISQGDLGSIQAINGVYTKGILHNGSHLIDLIRYLTDSEVCWVDTYKSNERPDGDISANVTLALDTDTIVTLQACHEDFYNIFELDILGTRGRLSFRSLGHQISVYWPEKSLRYPGYRELGKGQIISRKMHNTTLNAVSNLVDCVNGKGKPVSSGTDAVMDLAVVSAIIKSAHEGTRIEVAAIKGDPE